MANSRRMADTQAGSASPSPATSLSRLGPRFVLSAERRDLLRANLIVFLLTFLVYWGLGPKVTNYDYQLSQANNILHGHVDMSPEYTRHLNVLERVLYDGEGFCLPVDDPRGPESYEDIANPRITANCKNYLQHSVGPALLVLPLVAIFGMSVNQTLISIFIGALTAVVVFAIVRHFIADRRSQYILTALASFGTTFAYSAADGGVWHFAHACDFFFLMLAIWATVVRRSPLMAGAFIGAAFLCRPTTVLGGFFPLVYFANEWLNARPGVPLRERINFMPLIKLAAGVAPFVLLGAAWNYVRFQSPFESGYNYSEEFHQLHLAFEHPYGVASPLYMGLHVRAFFEQMFNVSDQPPYIWPSWWGMATWVTTPPFLYALFVHLKRVPVVAYVGLMALLATCSFMLFTPFAQAFISPSWGRDILDTGIQVVPFWLLIGAAVIAAVYARDRLALACWAAILAIGLADFTFAATGYAQFGYRYSLDYMPFLFVLIIAGVGQKLQWHHLALIAAAIIVNLWGALWIFQFSHVPPNGLFGWTWVSY
jgi:hypothetical protein